MGFAVYMNDSQVTAETLAKFVTLRFVKKSAHTLTNTVLLLRNDKNISTSVARNVKWAHSTEVHT